MADEKRLPKEVQLFIVEQLARFRNSPQIIKSVNELYTIKIAKQQVHYYSQICTKPLPEKAAQSSKDLQNYFKEERENFKKNIESIGGFHQPFRLQVLQDELEDELAKSYPLKRTPIILEIIEQMAKEVGGMFTNRRELTGKNGQPLIPVEQMAVALFKSLVGKGLSESEAADFAAQRYSVDKEKIVNGE